MEWLAYAVWSVPLGQTGFASVGLHVNGLPGGGRKVRKVERDDGATNCRFWMRMNERTMVV